MIDVDIDIFRAINVGLSSAVLDPVMATLAYKPLLMAVFALGGLLAYIFGSAKLRWALFWCGVVFVCGDVIVYVVKNSVMQVRPCTALEWANVIAKCSDSYSFPSRHTTAVFGVMVVMSLNFKRGAAAFLGFAMLMAFSRVYAGMHYPFDVLVGALLGTGFAIAAYYIDKYYGEKYLGKVKNIFTRDRDVIKKGA